MTRFELGQRVATPPSRRRVGDPVDCLPVGSGLACTGRFSDGGGGGSSTGTGSPGTAGRAPVGAAGTDGPGSAGALGTGGTGGRAEPPPTCTAGSVNPGRTPLRRLNGAEYDNTVRDLLGVTKSYSATFPADNQGVGFSNNADACRRTSCSRRGIRARQRRWQRTPRPIWRRSRPPAPRRPQRARRHARSRSFRRSGRRPFDVR